MRQNVVSDKEVSLHSPGPQSSRRILAKERNLSRYAPLLCTLGHVSRRLDSQHRHSAPREILQQVTVIAGDLDDLALPGNGEKRNHLSHIGLGVPQPRIRERREIGVVAEYVLRTFPFLELNEKALTAHEGLERIEWLHLLQIFRLEIGVRKRRHAEIDEHVLEL